MSVELEKVKKSRKPKLECDPPGFEAFWDLYPKKASRKLAASCFGRIHADHHPSIMADLDKRVRSEDWRKDAGKYIPNASTYLNQERWKDEATQLPKVAATARVGWTDRQLLGLDAIE